MSGISATETPDALKRELDEAFERYEQALPDAPIAYQQDMHVNMCIRLAGFLERLMYEAVKDYVVRMVADESARSFALSWWKRSPNLTPKAFDTLVERFGEEWLRDLGGVLGDGERASLGNLLHIRNDAAHGRNYSGSRPEVSNYRALVDSLYAWVIDRFY